MARLFLQGLRPLFKRRDTSNSSKSTRTDSIASTAATSDSPSPSFRSRSRVRKSSSAAKLREKASAPSVPTPVVEQRESLFFPPTTDGSVESSGIPEQQQQQQQRGSESDTLAGDTAPEKLTPLEKDEPAATTNTYPPIQHPAVVLQQPSPDAEGQPPRILAFGEPFAEVVVDGEELSVQSEQLGTRGRDLSRSVSPKHIPEDSGKPARRQSLVNSTNANIVKTLVEAPAHNPLSPETGSSVPSTSAVVDCFNTGLPTEMANALRRKIWVRRPGQSATLVQIREDDLVDDVRDMILRKYANSLGKTFDAPDMTLRISARSEPGQPRAERMLGPEEEMCRTIDAHFPGGQTVEDALVIDVPQKRTPRHSPRAHYQQPMYHPMDEYRPMETGTDYFPQMPMPMPAIVHPVMPQTAVSNDSRASHHHPSVAGSDHQRSISILNTGHLPPLPSPGGRRHRELRPKFARQHTSSPTIIQHPSQHSNAGAVAVNPPMPHGAPAPAAPPLPTPPAPEAAPTIKGATTPPTPSSALNPHRIQRPRKARKATPETSMSRNRRDRKGSTDTPNPNLSVSNMLDASIPPINVLIVEDNIINLRILEGLMKRLKVRWETAMNGQIAVDKWRKGGYHLVLMDIQMPIMNGLQATKEIRRLEKVNGIGVFSSSSAPGSPVEQNGTNGETTAEDGTTEVDTTPKPTRRKSTDFLPLAEGTFKSPIIIVALTASSLQSDRHEALAAGCNDFLTKPVNFVWLERKVKEWGCMQALIDFDGWRKWKQFAAVTEAGKSEEEKRKDAEKEAKMAAKMEKLAKLQAKQKEKRDEEAAAKKKKNRASVDGSANGDAPSITEQPVDAKADKPVLDMAPEEEEEA